MVAVLDDAESAGSEQLVAQLYAATPGQVVITGPGFGKGARLAVLA